MRDAFGICRLKRTPCREASPKQNKWFSAFAKFRDEKEPTREMLLALVEKIYVNEDKQVHIVLNYQDEMKKLFQEEV